MISKGKRIYISKPSSLTNTTFRAQERLGHTLNEALEEIEKKSGCIGFMLVGGPEPKSGGDLVIVSYVLYIIVSQQLFIIISRAHSGTTKLGANFSQAHSGWRAQIEEPFLAFLNKAFSASPIIYLMLTSINSYLAREMRQEFALPRTVSIQDSSALPTTRRDQHNHTNSDATSFTAALDKETDDASGDTTDLEMLLATLDDSGLYRVDGSNSGSKGSVDCPLYLRY